VIAASVGLRTRVADGCGLLPGRARPLGQRRLVDRLVLARAVLLAARWARAGQRQGRAGAGGGDVVVRAGGAEEVDLDRELLEGLGEALAPAVDDDRQTLVAIRVREGGECPVGVGDRRLDRAVDALPGSPLPLQVSAAALS
jgi:hypothetical protein